MNIAFYLYFDNKKLIHIIVLFRKNTIATHNGSNLVFCNQWKP